MIAELKAALEGVKYAKEALTFGVNLKVDEKVKEQVGDAKEKIGKVQDALLTIQDKLAALHEENLKLKEQLRQKENWEQKIANFNMVETPGGAVVYQHSGQPPYFVCPSCASKEELHILQDRRVISGIFDCPGCKSTFPVNKQSSGAGTVALKSKWGGI
jgi:transposase-like protein